MSSVLPSVLRYCFQFVHLVVQLIFLILPYHFHFLQLCIQEFFAYFGLHYFLRLLAEEIFDLFSENFSLIIYIFIRFILSIHNFTQLCIKLQGQIWDISQGESSRKVLFTRNVLPLYDNKDSNKNNYFVKWERIPLLSLIELGKM